ncbi:hypothetical protein C8J56DRAFT_235604 [Mycena floridula]|nr:hypothetical protein C8J56DRAFT_235604 [Mycena floridula]
MSDPSERQPLLDAEAGGIEGDSRRVRLAEQIESPWFHKSVIFLISVDAGCVLTDLGYTLLSDCSSAPANPRWLEVASFVSLGITSLFLAEIPLALTAFGWNYYNPFGQVVHAGLHLFDAFIIVSTFVLELVLKGRERELAGLLVVLRLWRLVKLVGGIAVGAGELGEQDVKALIDAQRELDSTKAAFASAQKEIQQLKARLSQTENE